MGFSQLVKSPELAEPRRVFRVTPASDLLHRLRLIVQGSVIDVREGSWLGNLVIIEFPALAHARKRYESPEYRAILPLRTRHIESDTILVDGVERDDDSAAMAAQLRASGWLVAS